MDILIVMLAGVLIGNRFFPPSCKKWNERLQVACTALLIFTMGISMGQRENFLQELSQLGLTSFLFFLFPAAVSTIFVYFLSRWFLDRKGGR
ncbi:MAG TPA: LysO family transporter [Candidatus Lachnoclostridium pullistercoris]|uniref:LysO family transporter n=1 Tax=Candidatus Lachnoclostridium pullistercoris TaxID=2838632 RepID=A0A9D2T7Z1_9FIRM|nr:LysO family transporter [Candidatus Lachnoclostridium pullistercoris]